MAAITASNVTIVDSWEAGSRSGKFVALVQRVAVVLAAQGATAGDLPASAFGLAEIYEVTPAVLDASGTFTEVGLAVVPTGLSLFPGAYATGLPANLTGTLYFTLTGRAAI